MGDLRVGFSRVDITPSPGCEMAGMGKGNYATSVLHPLCARTLVLQDDRSTVAIVAADLLGVDKELTGQVRQKVAAEIDFLMMTASHCHYGPCTRFVLPYPRRDGPYLQRLVVNLAAGILEAKRAVSPARVFAGRGRLDEAVNRRIRMPDGSLCPVGEVGRFERLADGPVDDEVGVIQFRDHAGHLLGVLYNYTAHPVCLRSRSTRISADYPGVASRLLERKTGAVAMFTNGACGNIAPRGQLRGLPRAKQIGAALAGEVLSALGSCSPVAVSRLAFKAVPVVLPVRREVAEDWHMHRRVRRTDSIESEANILTFGEVALVGIPGEAFVEMALETKQRSPFAYTYLLYVTNDDLMYIPTPQAYREGGYEVSVAVLGPQAFGTFVEESVRALKKLKRQLGRGIRVRR